jgi:ribokinase
MIVIFGSINLDLVFAVPHLPAAGDTVLTQSVRITPGGKGANQAVAAAYDGAKVVLAGAVGHDALAAPALAGLRAAGIDVARVISADQTTGCAAIMVDDSGFNAIAVGSGANLVARADQIEEALLGPDTLLLLQMETDAEQTAALIRRARATGARIILNLAPAAPLARDALQALDLLVVNETEAAWLGADLRAGANAASLRQALGVDVVRTMGGEGAELATINVRHYIPPHPVVPIDTTAAGDCFTGILAAGLDRGLDLLPALHRAAVAAALCCSRRGSQESLPSATEIDEAFRDYDSSRPVSGIEG